MSNGDPIEALRQRGERVPAIVRNLLMAPAIVGTAYFAITDSGPFLAIKEFEAGLTGGKYHPVLVGALTFVIFMVPAAILVQLLAGFFPEKK